MQRSADMSFPQDADPAAQPASVVRSLDWLELQRVMRVGMGFSLPYLFALVTLALVMAGTVPRYALALWCASYLVYIAARHTATLSFRGDPTRAEPRRVRFWRRWVVKSAAVHGLILGSPAWMALPELPLRQQFLLIWVVFAMCAAAAIFAASIIRAMSVLLCLAVLPYIIVLFFIEPSLAAFFAGTWAFCEYMGRHNHRALEDGFALTLHNESLARELERKNHALTLSNQSKTAILAKASEELRQPVHALELALAATDDQSSPQHLLARLQSMRGAVQALSDMLTGLMDLGRLEARTTPADIRSVPIAAMLQDLAQRFSAEARHKGLTLEVGGSALVVQSDAELLRLIMAQLVGNAIRYTATGTVSVTCESMGVGAVLRVADTGPGMPARLAQEVVEVSFRRAPASRRVAQGLGIGLAIVRTAAALLGHRVQVDSSPGAGTSVSVYLPLAEGAPPPFPAPAVSQGRSGICIAVLDANAVSLEALCDLLHKWGHRPVGGRSFGELSAALARSVEGRPQLFICELDSSAGADTPGGSAAIQSLRAALERPGLPALLVTSKPDASVALRADGENIILAHKPLGPQRLSRLLETVLVRGGVVED